MRPSSVLIAYEKIRDKIFRRELLPGDNLVELKLVEELKMSRTPIRKAIDMLIDEGLAERIPNKCTFVKSTVQGEIIMSHELCEALDGMAAYLLAEQIANGMLADSDLNVLRQLVDDMDRSFINANLKRWAELDKLFHITLVMLSGNEFIIQANQKNYQYITELLWFKVIHDSDKKESNRMHLEMVSTIASGNMEKSRKLAQEHRRRIINEMKSNTKKEATQWKKETI